jgi:hypothetical protein
LVPATKGVSAKLVSEPRRAKQLVLRHDEHVLRQLEAANATTPRNR